MVYSQRPTRGDRELALPTIVFALGHRAFLPLLFADLAHLEYSGQFVVALLVDVGADDNLLADDTFDGKATAVDLRRRPLR
jgi:hypothetical protein